ncbi:MAG: hypothetical protein JNM18_20235, partial [Planctomycetaceae bacterium]|nr:hypothetical protein [Planctomycetaceae bacterium]
MITPLLRYVSLLAIGCGLLVSIGSPLVAQDAIPAIPRTLPPPGIEIPSEKREPLVAATKQLGERLKKLAEHELYADVAVF